MRSSISLRNTSYFPDNLRGSLVKASLRTHLRVLLAALVISSALLSAPSEAVCADYLAGVPTADLPQEVLQQAPSLSGGAAILVAPDGSELWAMNPDEQRSMASITKIMTAVIVLESVGLDEQLTVSARAAGVGESAANLRAGDTLSVRKMLEALLVKSGNDAAIALAEHVSGTEEEFVRLMNQKAAALGLSSTRFANSHGLDAPGHHTSARDLAVLAQYAMRDGEFRRCVGLTKTILNGSAGSRELENSNLLIGTLVGATGIKTGWTSKAGYCLAASAKRHDLELTAVILGAGTENSRFDRARTLLEWGFEHYSMQSLASADETVGKVPVADYLDVDVVALVEEDLRVGVLDLEGDIVRTTNLYSHVEAPVSAGSRLGTLTFTQGDRLLAQVPVVAAVDVDEPGLFERAWIGIVRWWRGLGGANAPAM